MVEDIVFLDYTFLFDANESFQRIAEFEKVIMKAFDISGYRAKVIETIASNTNRRIIVVSKKIEVPIDESRSRSVKQIKDQFIKKRDFSGKYRT